MARDRLFKQAYAPELLRVAAGDLEAAEALTKAGVRRQEIILFHVEQAIEKTLKALLCWRGMAVPMTHDLAVVIDRFPAGEAIPHGDDIVDLSQFATIRRYEEGVALFAEDEIEAALRAARDIVKWASSEIGVAPVR